MTREIYEVYATIVDANGTCNALTGYPKRFDSKNYDGDVDKARQRALGEWHDTFGTMCKRDDRQVQVATLCRVSDGMQLECAHVGSFPDEAAPAQEQEAPNE